MDEIYGILKLDSDLIANFALQGRLIENNIETDRILKRTVHTFKEIQEKVQPGADRLEIPQRTIDEVLDKVQADVKQGGASEWETRELRILSYYFQRLFKNQEAFIHAVKLIDSNWRDIFIGGLVFFLMETWNFAKPDLREMVSATLRKHLATYNGGIKRYLAFKEHADLFEPAGPSRLASLLHARNISLFEAPSLIGLRNTTFSKPYFSDVILCYLRKIAEPDMQLIRDILEKHPFQRTKKLVFANLILDAEQNNNAMRQELVAKTANSILGDLSLSSTWAPHTGATVEEIEKLDAAHHLVVGWYARKSIEAFFNVCVQDARRRVFWLKYTDYISDFRIVGSTTQRTALQSDGRVSTMLRTSFIETNSRTSSTAALVLYIDDKVFVEFSDTGSVYIYNTNRPIIKNLKGKRFMDSTADLKSPNIGMAVEQYSEGWYGAKSYSFNSEGRLTHQGEWETRLRRWFDHEMQLKPGQRRKFTIPTSPEPKPASIPHKTEPVASEPVRDIQPSVTNSHSLFPELEKERGIVPGSRIREVVATLASKKVFENSCRVVANDKGFYLQLMNSNRYYYLCSNSVKLLTGASIWLTKSGYANQFNVVIDYLGGNDSIGTLSKVEKDIIFKPLGGHNVYIHTA